MALIWGANQGKGLFNDPQMGKVWRDYSDTLFMLNGWSGSKAVAEMESHGRELDLLPRASKVAGRPVLLLSADTDVVPAKTHTEPLYQALKSTPASKITYLTIQDDHSFSASRLAMIDTVIRFLNKGCR